MQKLRLVEVACDYLPPREKYRQNILFLHCNLSKTEVSVQVGVHWGAYVIIRGTLLLGILLMQSIFLLEVNGRMAPNRGTSI